MNENWKKLKKALFISVLLSTVILSGVSAYFYGPVGGAATLISSLCIALGFWITEGLIGVFTGVKRANPTAMGLLVLGKFGWWGLLFALARYHPPGTEIPIAIGLGAFLLSLVITALSHFGWPQISDVK